MAPSCALVCGASPELAAAVVPRLAAAGRRVAVRGPQVPGAALVLSTDRTADETVAAVERELGPLGALVCAVPVPQPAPFVGRDPRSWSTETSQLLTPAFAVVRAAAPSVRRVEDGRIVLVGVGWTPTGLAGATIAAAAHGALVAMVKTLARDLGPDGTTVNEVVGDAADPPGADALAHAVAYLCSPQAGAVVGQLLTVGPGGALRP